MSQKMSADGFKWMESTSQFSKDFVKNYHEYGDDRYFFKLIFRILKKYMNFMIFLFCLKE